LIACWITAKRQKPEGMRALREPRPLLMRRAIQLPWAAKLRPKRWEKDATRTSDVTVSDQTKLPPVRQASLHRNQTRLLSCCNHFTGGVEFWDAPGAGGGGQGGKDRPAPAPWLPLKPRAWLNQMTWVARLLPKR